MSTDRLQLRFRLDRRGLSHEPAPGFSLGFSLDVDLDLPGGGIIALTGASGAGKTTCLRCIAGLERPAQARLVFRGEIWEDSTRRLHLPVHSRGVGYVFQEDALFPHLSVRANLDYGLKRQPLASRRMPREAAIDVLGLSALLERMPATLSGGERQRVGIARALLASPRLLLMDEPLASLDAARKQDILPWLKRLGRELDMTILYVSHAADEVRQLADHQIVLAQGRVLASESITHPFRTDFASRA